MEPTDRPPQELPDNVVDITAQRREAVRLTRTPWEGDEDAGLLTRQTASAIAHIAHQLRPSWSLIELMAALENCKDIDPGLTALAAITAARDKNVRHPSSIPHAGPHWPREADDQVQHLQSVSDIAKGRDTSGWTSHSVGFATGRCRSYLTNARDKNLPTDPLLLADFKARGVNVDALIAEIYR